MQPKVYISYSHGKPSSVTAMFYVEAEVDLYGWYMAAKERQLSTAFFMVENFYADRRPVLYRSKEDDVYDAWITDYPPAKNIIRCPLPESFGHELERIQSRFVQEWLFFENDPNIGTELAEYRDRGLPVHAANIRSKKLRGLGKSDQQWIHTTSGTDFNVAEFLEKHWRPQEKSAMSSH
jgi:hypothetical protein